MSGASRVEGIILDLAGTTIDFGSLAPVDAIREGFTKRGIDVTVDEARGPMGMAKRAHLKALLSVGRVRGKWIAKYGSEPSETDIDVLYEEFIPAQLRILRQHSKLIAGVGETLSRIRANGLKIATCTGYNREMTDVVLEELRGQGFSPDAEIAATDVSAGRPAPWMAFVLAERLGIYPMWKLVKIGDTRVDVEEGQNAGMWTVAVTDTGNEMGLSHRDYAALPPAERSARSARIAEGFRRLGAHYTASSLADCLPIVEEISARVSRGDRP